MVQLGNEIQRIFEQAFDAKVILWSVQSNGPTFMPYGGHFPNTYTLTIEVRESDAKYMQAEYPAHTIQGVIRHGIIDEVLGSSGRLMQMTTQIDYANRGFHTHLEFATHDPEAFVAALRDFSWKAYSSKFDQLMHDTLSED